MNNKLILSCKFELPEPLVNSLYEASGFMGDTARDLIINSIDRNLSNLSENSINDLNTIFRNKAKEYEARRISLQEMTSPSDFVDISSSQMNFWEKLATALSENDSYQEKIKNLKIINEDRAPIEGDGEDPDAEDQAPQDDPANGDQDPGVDQDPAQDQAPVDPNNPDGAPQVDENGNPIDPQQAQQPQQPLTPEQQMQMELAQTDNKFMAITLFDQINDLIDTIDTIRDKTSSSKTEENLDLFDILSKYQNYLKILAELIFVMDLNTVYYSFTSCQVEINDLLNKYLVSTKVKIINDKDISPQEKENTIDDLKQNYLSQSETDQEISQEGNE